MKEEKPETIEEKLLTLSYIHDNQITLAIGDIEALVEKAREEIAVEIWHFLNLLEVKQPEYAKENNWRNWKYIRNNIADRYCPKDMRHQQEIVDRLGKEK